MTSDVNVYIALNGSDKRRVIVDGNMSMVIDLLRELGREVLAERERAALEANSCAPIPEQNSEVEPSP
jgi:hypothetical protein